MPMGTKYSDPTFYGHRAPEVERAVSDAPVERTDAAPVEPEVPAEPAA